MDDILNTIKSYNYKKLIIPSTLLIAYLIGFIYLYNLINTKENIQANNITMIDEIKDEKEEVKTEEQFIYIDIKGYINKPGVYKLNSSSRVIDAIEIAKGLKKGANTRFINLSKSLSDGDVIVVYSDEEIKKAKKTETIVVETPCVCEEVKNNACYEEEQKDNTKVNINTANIEELTTLTGIGESKATSIIDYRTNNGLFLKIEDIVNVTGISETIFSKIKENITV